MSCRITFSKSNGDHVLMELGGKPYRVFKVIRIALVFASCVHNGDNKGIGIGSRRHNRMQRVLLETLYSKREYCDIVSLPVQGVENLDRIRLNCISSSGKQSVPKRQD